MQQRWKTDPTLHSCETEKIGDQVKKKMDYKKVYIQEFLNQDPLRDWESISRCQWLWNWCMGKIYDLWPHEIPKTWKILDCGTKDGNFPAWLRERGYEQAMGIEISWDYVGYARNKGRPVVYGDVCNMKESWFNNFDFVFSHHLHGLTPDYLTALFEMYKVTNKYMVALNQVPGNKRKHYSYIESPDIFSTFLDDEGINCEKVIHNEYLETGFGNEWVIFIKKE